MIKYITGLVVITLFSLSCATNKLNYTTTKNGEEKILKGIINRSIIENDTSFKWFTEYMKYGTADANAVKVFAEKKDKFNLVVFGGTWCHDTQNLLPVFYRLIDKSNFPDKKILLVGVDRNKQTINDLHTQYKIVNVPTFIVLENGKEIGRVVEYGKYSAIDKELGEIVATIK